MLCDAQPIQKDFWILADNAPKKKQLGGRNWLKQNWTWYISVSGKSHVMFVETRKCSFQKTKPEGLRCMDDTTNHWQAKRWLEPVSVCPSVCLFASPYIWLILILFVYHRSLSLSLSLPLVLSFRLPVFLPSCLSICLSICLRAVYLAGYMSFWLVVSYSMFIHVSIWLSTYLITRISLPSCCFLFVYPSTYLPTYPPIYVSVRRSVHPSVRLLVCVCVCLSLRVSRLFPTLSLFCMTIYNLQTKAWCKNFPGTEPSKLSKQNFGVRLPQTVEIQY